MGFQLGDVKAGQYPYHEGQVWADADVKEAAKHMRIFAEKLRDIGAGVGSAGVAHPVPEGGWPVFSAADVGRRYRERLEEIWRQQG